MAVPLSGVSATPWARRCYVIRRAAALAALLGAPATWFPWLTFAPEASSWVLSGLDLYAGRVAFGAGLIVTTLMLAAPTTRLTIATAAGMALLMLGACAFVLLRGDAVGTDTLWRMLEPFFSPDGAPATRAQLGFTETNSVPEPALFVTTFAALWALVGVGYVSVRKWRGPRSRPG